MFTLIKGKPKVMINADEVQNVDCDKITFAKKTEKLSMTYRLGNCHTVNRSTPILE